MLLAKVRQTNISEAFVLVKLHNIPFSPHLDSAQVVNSHSFQAKFTLARSWNHVAVLVTLEQLPGIPVNFNGVKYTPKKLKKKKKFKVHILWHGFCSHNSVHCSLWPSRPHSNDQWSHVNQKNSNFRCTQSHAGWHCMTVTSMLPATSWGATKNEWYLKWDLFTNCHTNTDCSSVSKPLDGHLAVS